MEKLVEEIDGLLDRHYVHIDAIPVEKQSADIGIRNKQMIRRLITRIGNAYAEGMKFGGLPLPDEIERVGLETPLAKWIDDMVGVGAEIFIALRRGE